MNAIERRWVADGNAVNVKCGFVPDLAILVNGVNQTNPNLILYSKQMEDNESMYGIVVTGSSGVITRITTAATGMEALSTRADMVLIPHPSGTGLAAATVSDWASGTSYSSGERTTTTVGTVVRPPIHNGRVFELTTDTGSGTSEPSSWDVAPGETVTDGGSNIWTCREERVVSQGAQGITVGATIQTDSQTCALWAFKFDDSTNAGDAANVGSSGVV